MCRMPNSQHTILQVEDDPNDVFFLQHAFELADVRSRVLVAHDGEEAIAYLSGAGAFKDRVRYPFPTLILLDLKLPRRSGLDVLRWLREESGLPPVAVVVFSSSGDERDVDEAYRLGANSYVSKPLTVDDRTRFVKVIHEYWFGFCKLPGLAVVSF
jgi:CheY-like chemotaxis protein